MNREIKFRGKSKIGLNPWIKGYLLIDESENHFICFKPEDDEFQLCPVFEESVGEFTGLKDKNGVDIFEGDVCLYDDNESMSIWTSGEQFVVVGLKGRFTARMSPFNEFDGANQNMMNEDVEDCVTVIGNIYENPELLNK